MLKTISAALLAVSVIAAPALAASSTDQAPASKTTRAPAGKTDQAPAAKTTQVKPSAMNANAKMGSHHGRHHVKHHRSHKKMTSFKPHKISKVSSKPVAPAAKRG